MRLITVSWPLAAFILSTTFALADVRVYRPDGTLKCSMAHERTLAEDRKVLEQLGGKILSAEKRVIPVEIISVCGAPTGRANTFVISNEDWTKIQPGFTSPVGFATWNYDPKTVAVYKYNGTQQCDLG